jgi:hypothetical protein
VARVRCDSKLKQKKGRRGKTDLPRRDFKVANALGVRPCNARRGPAVATAAATFVFAMLANVPRQATQAPPLVLVFADATDSKRTDAWTSCAGRRFWLSHSYPATIQRISRIVKSACRICRPLTELSKSFSFSSRLMWSSHAVSSRLRVASPVWAQPARP